MPIKAVIFDLDGVICSTDEYHYLAWKALADRLGICFDRSINERLRGVSRMESLEIILERSERDYSQEEKELFCTEKNERYRGLLSQMSGADLSEEVRSTLMTLRGRGLALAIGSSSRNAPYILERIGLGDFFDAVADGSQIEKSKPDPEVFQLAAKKLDVKPCDAIVVEDAAAGIKAAKRGGFISAAIGSAQNCRLSDYKLNAISELVDIVKCLGCSDS